MKTNNSQQTQQWIEIFDAEAHDRDWPKTANDISAIVENYQTDFHEAPVKLDHKDGGPAAAWVKELKADGTRLLARFSQVSDWFTELVNSGQFKKRSVELYRDLLGKGPYLRAVAFLGAAIPEVKGLRNITFREDEPDFEAFIATTRDNSSYERFQELLSENQQLRDELQLLNDQRDLVDFERFLEDQRQHGKPVASWVEHGVIDLFMHLLKPAETFQESGDAPCQALKNILAATPAVVTFGEIAKPEESGFSDVPSEFDIDSLELARRADQYIEQNPNASFAEALVALKKL